MLFQQFSCVVTASPVSSVASATMQRESKGDAVAPSNMSAQERELFLAAPHVGVMSINRLRSSAPLATPVWNDCAAGGEVTVQIQRTSLKYRLFNESGAFTLTVQDEEYPYGYVSGYVSVSGDATFLRRVTCR